MHKLSLFCLQLHHVGTPASRSIAPVTYMWRPLQRKDVGPGAEHNDVESVNSTQTNKCCSSLRQLWVWMHASAFNEGYDALKFACQKLVKLRLFIFDQFLALSRTQMSLFVMESSCE